MYRPEPKLQFPKEVILLVLPEPAAGLMLAIAPAVVQSLKRRNTASSKILTLPAAVNRTTRKFSKTELRRIANRLFRNNKRKTGLTYDEILEDEIEDYEIEKYEDRKFSILLFGYFKGHQSVWLGSSHTDEHGDATYDFASLSMHLTGG